MHAAYVGSSQGFGTESYSILATAENVLGRPAGKMTVQDLVTLKCPQQTHQTCATCTAAESASWGKDNISARTVRDELSTIGRRAGWPVRPSLLTPPKTSHLTGWGQTEATINSSAVPSGPDEPLFGLFWARIKHALHYKDVISFAVQLSQVQSTRSNLV